MRMTLGIDLHQRALPQCAPAQAQQQGRRHARANRSTRHRPPDAGIIGRAKRQHGKRAHSGATRDTQHRRIRQGVTRDALKQRTCQRKRSAADKTAGDTWRAHAPQNCRFTQPQPAEPADIPKASATNAHAAVNGSQRFQGERSGISPQKPRLSKRRPIHA